jgi:hypothetical protein
MPGFDSLHQQKRGTDANTARRQSLSDQQIKPGILGQFFHKYVASSSGKHPVLMPSHCLLSM